MHAAVIALVILVAGVLLLALIGLGDEMHRLNQSKIDGQRLKDLVELEGTNREIEATMKRIWEQLGADREELRKIAAHLQDLWDTKEDDDKRFAP